MNILMTNIWLANYAGTEVGVRDLSIALHQRGFHVEVYSPELGAVAEEIRQAGIFITDTLDELVTTPDIIHAQHFIPSLDVMLKFPEVPAIYVLHDRTHPADSPPKYSQVLKYYAVDYNCLDRLILDNGMDEQLTGVIYNWVDTDRFKLRPSIAEKPARAVVFSNYANKANYFRNISHACKHMGISLDVIGDGFKTSLTNPEKYLQEYDIVFAKAKAAMESLATGAGVITCDFRGLGGFVTPGNFEENRKYNFGMKTLTRPVESGLLVKEIKKYNKADILGAALMIREQAAFGPYVDKITGIYQEAISEFKRHGKREDGSQDLRTLQEYIRQKISGLNEKLSTGKMEKGIPAGPDLGKIRQNEQEIEFLQKNARAVSRENSTLRSSWSYRIGRAITYLPRYLYGLFK